MKNDYGEELYITRTKRIDDCNEKKSYLYLLSESHVGRMCGTAFII